MKRYKFGTKWPDWAWKLVSVNKVIISGPQYNGPFDHCRADDVFFFVYGKAGIEVGHYGDYLIYNDDGTLTVVKG